MPKNAQPLVLLGVVPSPAILELITVVDALVAGSLVFCNSAPCSVYALSVALQ
jgi:hypothetical protein